MNETKSKVVCVRLDEETYKILSESAFKRKKKLSTLCCDVLTKYALGADMKEFEMKNRVFGRLWKHIENEGGRTRYNIRELYEAVTVLIEMYRLMPKIKPILEQAEEMVDKGLDTKEDLPV